MGELLVPRMYVCVHEFKKQQPPPSCILNETHNETWKFVNENIQNHATVTERSRCGLSHERELLLLPIRGKLFYISLGRSRLDNFLWRGVRN